MASLTIRNIDESLKAKLRLQSAQHGRSMEAEIREILHKVLSPPTSTENFADRVHKHFANLHLNSLTIPARQSVRNPPNLDS